LVRRPIPENFTLLYLLMGLFLLDICLRRVRLFGYRPMRAA
jgi:hypothetical protein